MQRFLVIAPGGQVSLALTSLPGPLSKALVRSKLSLLLPSVLGPFPTWRWGNIGIKVLVVPSVILATAPSATAACPDLSATATSALVR